MAQVDVIHSEAIILACAGIPVLIAATGQVLKRGPVLSRLHKAVVRFPQPEQSKPNPQPDDSAQVSSYLEHLLDLADQFFRRHPEKNEDEAA